MIKKITVALVIVFLSLTIYIYNGDPVVITRSEQELAENKATREIAKVLSKKYDLEVVGFGGSIHDTIEDMSLSFSCKRTLTLDEYRKLVVHCAEDYLEMINADLELKPYLHHYPFTSHDIFLMIFTYNEEGKRLAVGEMSCVSVMKGKVCFSIRKTKTSIEDRKEENFEEAKQLVDRGTKP